MPPALHAAPNFGGENSTFRVWSVWNHARERACCFVGKTHKWAWAFVDFVGITGAVRRTPSNVAQYPSFARWGRRFSAGGGFEAGRVSVQREQQNTQKAQKAAHPTCALPPKIGGRRYRLGAFLIGAIAWGGYEAGQRKTLAYISPPQNWGRRGALGAFPAGVSAPAEVFGAAPHNLEEISIQ